MTEDRLARKTGGAVLWKTAELAGTRGVALLRTLILARLLVPDDFGLLAIGVLVVDVSLRMTYFGMRHALVQKADLDSKDYDTAWTFELILGVLGSALVFLLAPFLAESVFAEPRAAGILRVLAINAAVDRARSIREVDLIRDLRFRPLAAIGLTGAFTHAAIAIGFAKPFGVWALVAGFLAGTVAQTVVTYAVAPGRPRLRFDLEAARPLLSFGSRIYLALAFSIAGSAVLQAVVSRRLGVAELGLYFLATRLSFVPREAVERIASQVAFPTHARLQAEGERAARMFRSAVTSMTALLVPVYAVAFALTEQLVETFVGVAWLGAVPVIRVLAAACVVGIVGDATVPLLEGRGRTGGVAAIFAIRSLVIVALVWPLAGRWGAVGAATAWLLAEAAGTGLAAFLSSRVLSRPLEGLGPRTAVIVVSGLGGAVLAIVVARVGAHPLIVLGAVVAGLVLSTAMLYRLDGWFRLRILSDLSAAWPRAAGYFQGK